MLDPHFTSTHFLAVAVPDPCLVNFKVSVGGAFVVSFSKLPLTNFMEQGPSWEANSLQLV